MTTTRPKWYDDKLVAYMPFARKCAHRLAGRDDVDEVVQDAYVDACNRWAMYDSENYKFGTWIFQVVRNACANRKTKAMAKKRCGSEWSMDTDETETRSDNSKSLHGSWLPALQPNQLDYAELSAVLRNLSGTRDSEALMRIAMGDELQDVAADLGVSRERVRQLAERERGRLRERMVA
ncbi:MAG: sigma-70 family RNA polymerase sigma factor [Rhizobium sp.]|nr:sigma-70 family RNA polymerase sigma factor [Rhizobium sp.]